VEGSVREIATKFREIGCHVEENPEAQVPSSVIRDFSYDPATSELSITFVSGRRYVYADVPQDVFDAFKAASSRGTFFNSEIRDDYSYCEVKREGGSGGDRKRRNG
jgi:KTSC domain-containing protein